MWLPNASLLVLSCDSDLPLFVLIFTNIQEMFPIEVREIFPIGAVRMFWQIFPEACQARQAKHDSILLSKF